MTPTGIVKYNWDSKPKSGVERVKKIKKWARKNCLIISSARSNGGDFKIIHKKTI